MHVIPIIFSLLISTYTTIYIIQIYVWYYIIAN